MGPKADLKRVQGNLQGQVVKKEERLVLLPHIYDLNGCTSSIVAMIMLVVKSCSHSCSGGSMIHSTG